MNNAEGFPNYVATTKDPGPVVFIVVLTYMVVAVVVLPLLVIGGQSYEGWRRRSGEVEEVDEKVVEEEGCDRRPPAQDASGKGAVLSTSIIAGEMPPAESETLQAAAAGHVEDDNGVDNELRTAATRSTSSPSIPDGLSKESSSNENGKANGREDVGGKAKVDDDDDDDNEDSPSYLPSNVVVDVGGGDGHSTIGKGVVSASSILTVEGRITPPMKRTPIPSPVHSPSRPSRKATTPSRVSQTVTGTLDKLMIPSYPSDEKISGRAKAKRAVGKEVSDSLVSAATTSAARPKPPTSVRSGPRPAMLDDSPSRHTTATGGLSPSRILDAGGRPGGRRRRHGMGFIRFDVVSRSLVTEEAAELKALEFTSAQRQNRLKAAIGPDQVMDEAEPGSPGDANDEGAQLQSCSGVFRPRHNANAIPMRPANKSMSDVASEALSTSGDDNQLETELVNKGTPSRRNAAGGNAEVVRRSPFRQVRQLRATGSFHTDTDDRSALKCTTTFDADDIGPNDAPDADDPGRDPVVPTAASPAEYGDPNVGPSFLRNPEEPRITFCCGPRAVWKPRTLADGLDSLVEVAEPDRESKRILLLAMPQTAAQLVEAALRLATVVLVGHLLGTDSLAALVVVEVLMGLTDELVAGVIDAENMICSEALANGDYDMAGQYMQIAVVLYVVCSIPLLGCWVVIMDDVLIFLGLPENIAFLGLDYAQIVAIHYLMEGVAQCYGCALDVTGRETFRTWFKIAEVTVNVVLLAILASTFSTFVDLVVVAFLHLVVGIIFFLILLFWGLTHGWLRPFWTGMVGTLALKNTEAVKTVVANAVPLSLGSFLEYGQFEILTFFVAHLGPAEVTTWAILGCIWEMFEASVEGLAIAAAIRVAYQLTRGKPGNAALSARKAVLLSAFSSLLVTALFYVGGRNLIILVTSDITLQNMLNELVPLVGLANLPMTFSMMCWSILGAQGRYRFATFVFVMSSWFVALPLAALLVFRHKFDLQGVVGAVAAGYVTSCLCLAYTWLRSDWQKLSNVLRGDEDTPKTVAKMQREAEPQDEEEKQVLSVLSRAHSKYTA